LWRSHRWEWRSGFAISFGDATGDVAMYGHENGTDIYSTVRSTEQI
jgi:hypothetical protein